MSRGEFLVALMIVLVPAFAHTGVLYKWQSVTPTLIGAYDMDNIGECIDEKVRGDDPSSWCEHRTNNAWFTAVYTWSGFYGDWSEVTGIRVGCSGTGSGWKNGVWAWDYSANSWGSQLGPCGTDGEAYWDLGPAYFDAQASQAKLNCNAAGGGSGAGATAELFVDRVYYSYNWFPTAYPEISPSPAFAHSNLSLVKNFTDLDGDQEANSSISWFLNEQWVSSDESMGEELAIGDVVKVEYRPCDSYGQCGQNYTTQLTVQDFPPSVDSIAGLGRVKGGTTQTFEVVASDYDENQTVGLSCAIDDPSVSSNDCYGNLSFNSGASLAFDCALEVPSDTGNHTLYCVLDDGFNGTHFSEPFETDLTPPEKGSVAIENVNNFTNQENAGLTVESTGASSMRFACTEDSLALSGWTAYSTNSSFSLVSGPGCAPGEGWKIVFVEFMDDVGNDQTSHSNATVFLDMTPPTTSDSSDQLIHLPGHNVTLYESDSHDSAGNILTYYCIGSNCTPDKPVENEGSISFTERGANILRYVSRDSAGNELSIERTVSINLLPEARASITPANPNSMNSLTCSPVNVSNEDGQQLTATARWSKNGAFAQEGGTLAAGQFSRGDNVNCVLLLNDGLEDEPSSNATVIIGNAPPQLSLSIKETNSIVCDFVATDADNDSLSVEQSWLRNDAYYSNATVIHDEELVPGYVFSCLVNASDGFTTVSMKESYVVASPVARGSSNGGGGSGGAVVLQEQSMPAEDTKREETPTQPGEAEPVGGHAPEEEKIEELTPEPLAEKERVEASSSATGFSMLAPAGIALALLVLVALIAARFAPRLAVPQQTVNAPKMPQGFSDFKEKWNMFPENAQDQKELSLGIARRLQEKYGSFHGAGVYQVLERLYGEQVSDRISIEKQVNESIKSDKSVEFCEHAGRKKLYRFKAT
jgi:hypothetical protein